MMFTYILVSGCNFGYSTVLNVFTVKVLVQGHTIQLWYSHIHDDSAEITCDAPNIRQQSCQANNSCQDCYLYTCVGTWGVQNSEIQAEKVVLCAFESSGTQK